MIRLLISTIIYFLLTVNGECQSKTVNWKDIAAIVVIDSITISAERIPLQVEDFVKLILNDESFYAAFKNLKQVQLSARHNLSFSNSEGEDIGTYRAISHQYLVDDTCRYMNFDQEEITGSFLKHGGELNFYTAKLYKNIFVPSDTTCLSRASSFENRSKSNLGHQIELMKQVVFNPGRNVDIPLLGKKMSIFSEANRKYYDFGISMSDTLGKQLFLFTVEVKPEYKFKKKKKTIIKKMDTYFDSESFKIIARNYHLKYKNALYDFDFKTSVFITTCSKGLIPAEITYDGYWDLLTKKPEICKFKINFENIK